MGDGPRIGSIASGMGGLCELGLAPCVGGTVAWHAEIDPDASKVLAHHWPDTPNLGDIKTVDWWTVEPVDFLTAGWPCQPWSVAGRRKGADDERHLWPHIAHAIGILRPDWFFGENVAGHLSMGFDDVLGSLTAHRYDTCWTVVRASDVGAAHRRERVFILARNTDRMAGSAPGAFGRGSDHLVGSPTLQRTVRSDRGHVPDAAGEGRNGGGLPDRHQGAVHGQPGNAGGEGPDPDTDWGKYGPAVRRWGRILGRPAPTPLVRIPSGRQALNPALPEWLMGLPEGWVTEVPGVKREAQLRIIGNGVQPQAAQLALSLLSPLMDDH